MNQQASAVAQGVVPTASKNFSLAGLFQVLVSPADFFDRLRHHPKVLVPLIAILVVSILSATLSLGLLTEQEYVEMMDYQVISDQYAQERADQNLTQQEHIDQQTQQRYFILAAVRIVAPLVIAALAMLIGNFIMGGQAKFKQIFSLVLYTEFIFVVGFLITSLLIFVKGSGLVNLSPALLVRDLGITSPTYVALSQLSVFHIWQAIALGIGANKIFEFKGNKGYLVAVISMGIVALIVISAAAGMNALLG